MSLQGCSLSSVKAHERGEWSNSCDSSSLTFFLNFWVYTPYTHWQNKAKNLDQTSRHCIKKKVNQDFSYSIWREHFNLVSLHQIQRPHTNQQKKNMQRRKETRKNFWTELFPLFLSWTPPIFRGTIYYKWLLKEKLDASDIFSILCSSWWLP